MSFTRLVVAVVACLIRGVFGGGMSCKDNGIELACNIYFHVL